MAQEVVIKISDLTKLQERVARDMRTAKGFLSMNDVDGFERRMNEIIDGFDKWLDLASRKRDQIMEVA